MCKSGPNNGFNEVTNRINLIFMIRFKDIHIPKPCSVDYDNLPGNEVKRFCSSCEKHVYDFRGKDEAFLNEVFQNTGKVCGIYYEDQIQRSSLKIQRPFYYAFITKIIGVGLFLKTLFNTYDTSATIPIVHQIQEAVDSTGINVEFKNRPYNDCQYALSIYINDTLYKSKVNANNGFLYLPDSIQSIDKIKVIVKRTKVHMLMSNKIKVYTVRHKKYNFTLKNYEEIKVKISFKKHFTIKRKKRLAGVPVGWW